ncbi:MAG: DEAD/DEAH box helicase [Candidatus Micrarchaeota archaeon]|nr:DEAD/DEAH box helicase [Candidatus Micrarchaeota archaeon]
MQNVKQIVLERSGFDDFNPVQQQALAKGLLEGRNLVVAAPTASGKTLVAELAAVNAFLSGKKSVYIVPLKALASEKYEEFNEKYSSIGMRTAMSIGDLDESDPWLGKYDVIIATSEKMDSLLRHGLEWLDRIGLLVVDEIHLLDDPGRGPTLEITITKLLSMIKPQILGLSATISNYEEIAAWLNADCFRTDYRPVKVEKGIAINNIIYFEGERKNEIPSSDEQSVGISLDTIKNDKQIIIFASTRRGAEATAEKVSDHIKKKLSEDERMQLSKIADEVAHALDRPTKQCKRLAACVRGGAAFHHAGLVAKQRSIIERYFKEGKIKMISATPTLAAGINLPAWRVFIKDMKRFSGFRGMDYLPVLEVQQMMGRSGRPKFDKTGEAILSAKDENEAEKIWEKYINGEPEKIQSKLGVEPVLRMHTLALVASGLITTEHNLIDFFSRTFYAHQYGDLTELRKTLDKVLALLEGFGFIKMAESKKADDNPFVTAKDMIANEGNSIEATAIGKRVSELYIDPITAHDFIEGINSFSRKKITPVGIVQLVCNTMEMMPLLSVRRAEMKNIESMIASNAEYFANDIPNPWEMDYDDFMKSVKTAMLIGSWMEESGEDAILDSFNVTPGELRARLDNADWLSYALSELCMILDKKNILKEVRKIRLRMKYGIKEELLPLVQIKGIGRVRARMLYTSGIRTIDDLKKMPYERLRKMLGEKTAKAIKEQVGESASSDRKSDDFGLGNFMKASEANDNQK